MIRLRDVGFCTVFTLTFTFALASCVKGTKQASRVKIDNGVFVLESGTYILHSAV